MYFKIHKAPDGEAHYIVQSIFRTGETNQIWSWQLKGANHKTIASGENYKTEAECLAAIRIKSTNSSTVATELRNMVT